MWKLLKAPYFITHVREAEICYIGVTDFRRYWLCQTPRKTFLADLKESNEGLEFENEIELLQRGYDMLAQPESVKSIEIKTEIDQKFLSVSMSKMYEITLRLELGLLEASAEHFFETVIQPLLKTVCDLRSSQSELRELLIRKDKEIEEYKIEGKVLRHLKTPVYDDAAHMTKHTTYEEYFSAPKVPELLESIATSSNNKRSRSPSPPLAIETQDIKIKECSQETVTAGGTVPSQRHETEASVVEVKSKRQKKRLNY